MKKKNRIGESRMMNCGIEATIVAYRGAMDIDVQFEDGYISHHRTYVSFKKGKILNKVHFSAKHVGESRMMNCGMAATIVAYRGAKDIDVRFEDGYIAKNKQYIKFTLGKIGNPNIEGRKAHTLSHINEIVGTTKTMNCGMNATIIEWLSSNNIIIRFEDGYTVHSTYAAFKTGIIHNPACPNKMERRSIECKKRHLGETRMMNCGMEATIIAYRNYCDIDVQFKDGTIVKNRNCQCFKRGSIGNPKLGKRRKTES